MKTFEFGQQEVSYRLRPTQPIYELLETVCLELGINHPSELLAKLIQEKYSELRRSNRQNILSTKHPQTP